MYRLGVLYSDPKNNLYNLPKAYLWFRYASLNGSKQSIDICRKIESSMTSDQLNEFNRRVDLEKLKVIRLK